jgi:DNA ligase-1
MNLYDRLEEIEKTSGTKETLKLLKKLIDENDLYKEIIKKSLDPMFITNVNDATIEKAMAVELLPVIYNSGSSEELLLGILNKLNNGEIKKGNETVEKIAYFMGRPYHGSISKKWIGRILIGNLRIGVNWNSFSKLCGIDKFDVMLANPLKDPLSVSYPCYVQPKLDGYRLVYDITDGGKIKSRNGKEYQNFPSLKEALNSCDIDVVLDGEIMSDDFQSIQKSAFATKRGSTVGDIVYNVFDLIPKTEWLNKKCSMVFSERYKLLKELSEKVQCIKVVDCYEVNSHSELLHYFKLFTDMGYEGLIVRMNTPYEFKRTKNLLKLKEFKTMDCTILDVVEGKGRLEGTTGALRVLQENGVECSVSGFNDQLKKELWENKKENIGKIIEVSYQELTMDNVMRFPSFVRFRDDK